MNDTTKSVLLIGTGATVLFVVLRTAYQTHKKEAAKRAKISEDTTSEFKAIRKAAAIMQEKIRNGDYDKTQSLAQIQQDFQFYIITSR